MKHFVIRNLHSLLGFENYLVFFSIFKILTLKLDRRKREYLYFTGLFESSANIIVIGANTGITTVPIAKKVNEGKVYAIEPVIENYNALTKVLKHYKLKNVETINIALGNENKMVDMIMPVLNDAKSHGLCHVNDESISGYKEGIIIPVKMQKLDELFLNYGAKINGIKIVAENYERFIFEGSEEVIKKNRPLIYCELWYNENREKTLDMIRKWNYDIKVLVKGRLVNYIEKIHFTKNLFFIPK